MTSGSKKPLARRVLLYLLAIIVVLAGVHLLFQHLNLNVYHELNGRVFEISNRVDFDDEASIPTWFSQLLLLSISVAGFIAAYLQRSRAAKQVWAVIGLIGITLSLDEVAALHELVLQIVHLAVFSEAAPTVLSNAWLVLLPFIALAGIILLIQALKHIPRKTIFIMAIGSFIFIVGSVFIDILTNANNVNNFYEKGVLVALEESLEMAGTSIILYGILDYLETSYGSKIRAAREKLRS